MQRPGPWTWTGRHRATALSTASSPRSSQFDPELAPHGAAERGRAVTAVMKDVAAAGPHKQAVCWHGTVTCAHEKKPVPLVGW